MRDYLACIYGIDENIGKLVAQPDFDSDVSIIHIFLTIKTRRVYGFHVCYIVQTSRVITLKSI